MLGSAWNIASGIALSVTGEPSGLRAIMNRQLRPASFTIWSPRNCNNERETEREGDRKRERYREKKVVVVVVCCNASVFMAPQLVSWQS